MVFALVWNYNKTGIAVEFFSLLLLRPLFQFHFCEFEVLNTISAEFKLSCSEKHSYHISVNLSCYVIGIVQCFHYPVQCLAITK